MIGFFPGTIPAKALAMKNNNNDTQTIDELLETVEILLEKDLENPEIEFLARSTLRQLKEKGHDLFDPDEDDGCLACLHLSLMSALGGVEVGYFDNDNDDDEDAS